MVKVAICRSNWDAETRQFTESLRATVTVEGQDLSIDGDPDYSDVNQIVVRDSEQRRDLRFPDDGEEWARLLPTAFRSGQIFARVLVDAPRDAAVKERRQPAAAMAFMRDGSSQSS